MHRSPKILIFSGSIRSGSLNTRLAATFVGELAKHDCEITRITLADYELPIYDGDLEKTGGIPENATKLAKLFDAHQGFLIVGPEYNGSITPLLKNTIDWVSRVKGDAVTNIDPYRGKVAAIAAASPGAMGGISTLGHLRDVLVRLGMLVISEQLGVGNGNSAFDETDGLISQVQMDFMKAECRSLVEKATLLG